LYIIGESLMDKYGQIIYLKVRITAVATGTEVAYI
jgi:hypothetical protein